MGATVRGRGWISALIGGIVVGLLGGARGRLTRFEIAEESMAPTLRSGDCVFAVRSGPMVRTDDIVIFPHPTNPEMDLVKRVAARPGEMVEQADGTLRLGPHDVFVLGDNSAAASVDSRALGPIPLASIEWRVKYRYWPPSRVGRVG